MTTELVLFWDGCFSNWHETPFTVDGQQYSCMEQYMMAEKARTFLDEEVRMKILASPHPKAQKEFGRKVRGYDDAVWAELRYGIVLKGVLEKFRQNMEPRQLLLDTGEAIIAEASPYDRIWGIGMAENHPQVRDQSLWGQNLLGKVLMEARAILRAAGPQ